MKVIVEAVPEADPELAADPKIEFVALAEEDALLTLVADLTAPGGVTGVGCCWLTGKMKAGACRKRKERKMLQHHHCAKPIIRKIPRTSKVKNLTNMLFAGAGWGACCSTICCFL